MLQCVAVCCSVLQRVAACCRVPVSQCVVIVSNVVDSVLQCVQCAAVCCNVLQYVAVCGSVLQCVAVCCVPVSQSVVISSW